MKTIEILTKARALISDPKNWAQEDYCRDGAVCAVGALTRARGLDATNFWDCTKVADERRGATKLLADEMDGHIPDFNDNHTHAEVLAAFDRAIAKAAAITSD